MLFIARIRKLFFIHLPRRYGKNYFSRLNVIVGQWIQYLHLREIDQFVRYSHDLYPHSETSLFDISSFFFHFFFLRPSSRWNNPAFTRAETRSVYVCIAREKNNRKIEEIKGNRNGKLFLDEHGPKVEHIRCMILELTASVWSGMIGIVSQSWTAN